MSSTPPRLFARFQMTLFAWSLAMTLSHAASAQSNKPEAQPADRPPPANVARGETVSELDHQIGQIFQDSKNHYWIGSRGAGLYRYDGKTLTHFTTKDGLATNQIRGIQEDKSGNLYISTFEAKEDLPDGKSSFHRGIAKFDGRTFRQLTIPQSDSPDAAWKYQPDDLWFSGEQNSGHVYRYDGKTVYRLRFPAIATGDGHFAKYPRTKYPNMNYNPYDVYSMFKDSKGNLWFGTGNLGVCRYDGKTHEWISKDDIGIDPGDAMFGVRSIIEDRDGKLWFTHAKHRFDVYGEQKSAPSKGVLNYKKEKGIENATDGDYFLSAVKDRNGDLWLATLGDGVWHYDGKKRVHYPVRVGNESIWISSIYRDRQDNLWLCTQQHGVWRFNGKAFEKFKF